MSSAGGREVAKISVRVVPDLDGFRQKVQREATAAAKAASGKKVKFDADVNARPAAAKAAKQASGQEIKFGTDVNKSKVVSEAAAAAKLASGNTIKFGVDIDRRGVAGLIRSITTGFNAVDSISNKSIIGRFNNRLIESIQRGLLALRTVGSRVVHQLSTGFNFFGRTVDQATRPVRTMGKTLLRFLGRSDLLKAYGQDVVDYAAHQREQFGKLYQAITKNNRALIATREGLKRIGESDAWAKMARGAEKAANHVRNIATRPIIPLKGRVSKAQKQEYDLVVNVDTKSVDKATNKLTQLRRMVSRTSGVKNFIDGDFGLTAAYGALKGWQRAKRVLGFMAKWGSIAAVAISALAPPLAAIGGYVGMAALGAIGAIGAGLAVIGTAGVGALFVGMAARSEEVKNAWSATRKSMAATFDAANKPVENALIRLAPQVASAFERMTPNIERVSTGVGALLDRFGGTLPDLADATGKAMEQIFESGRPGMEKLIDGLPNIVRGLGNMFEIIGNSDAIQRIWDGMVDGLPGFLESLGRGFDNSAKAAGKLFDWFKSPGLDDFRNGFSKLWEDLKNVDWTKAREGVEDMLNAIGRVAGDTDVQGLVDTLGNIATAISKVVDGFNNLGLAGTIGMGILGSVVAGVAKEIAGKVAGFALGKLLEKLFGTSADIAGEATSIGVEIAGKVISGLVGGLLGAAAAGVAGIIANLIGSLFGSDDAEEQKVKFVVEEIVWPEGLDGAYGSYRITEYLKPIGPGFEPTGFFQITEVLWPEGLENLTGKFEVSEIIWPGDLENLTGTFEITDVVFPDGVTSLSDSLIGLLAPLEQVNSLLVQLAANAGALTASLTEVVANIYLFNAAGLLMATTLAQVAASLQAVNTGLTNLLGILPTIPPSAMLLMSAMMLVSTAVLAVIGAVAGLYTGLINLYSTLAELIPQGVMTFITTLLQVPAAIAGFVAGLFSAGEGFGFFDGGLWGNRESISNFIGSIRRGISSLGDLVVAFFSTGAGSGFFDGGILGNIDSIESFKSALGTVGSAIGEMVSAIVAGVNEAVSVISTLPSRAAGALSGLGGALFGSGQALVQGFINGIRSMIDGVRAAASAVAAAARGFFPFSPAKEGPFSGRGYTTYSGKALVSDFAGGMLSERNTVVAAAEKVLKDTQKQFDDYNRGLVLNPVLESNAKKIADFRKKEADEIAKGSHNAEKAQENYRKMLESLEVPDYREMNLSFQSYYIDGAKGMFEKSLKDMRLADQLHGAVSQAVDAARGHFGDHPFLAQVETNINAEHFEFAVNKAIEESNLAAVPIEFAIANLDQLKNDLGFGNGVISRAMTAAMEHNPNDTDAYRYEKGKQEIHYHVTDLEEAMRLEDERRRRGALRFI